MFLQNIFLYIGRIEAVVQTTSAVEVFGAGAKWYANLTPSALILSISFNHLSDIIELFLYQFASFQSNIHFDHSDHSYTS